MPVPPPAVRRAITVTKLADNLWARKLSTRSVSRAAASESYDGRLESAK